MSRQGRLEGGGEVFGDGDEDELDYDERESDVEQDQDDPRGSESPVEAVLGPAMPPGFLQTKEAHREASSCGDSPEREEREVAGEDSDEEEFGPALPPDIAEGHDDGEEEEDDDDGCVIGPVLPPTDFVDDYEQRLASVQANAALKNRSGGREKWMLEPPEKLNNFGLGARTFQKSSGGVDKADSSGWTETPMDRKNKKADAKSKKEIAIALEKARNRERDEQQQQRAMELSANRGDALLDLHQRKRKAEQKVSTSSDETGLRRPFDKNKDIDSRAMRAKGTVSTSQLKERCGELNSRFGHGSSTQKFL